MVRLLIASLISLLIVSCGSNQPRGGGTYGYEEIELEDGLYHVKYTFMNWRGFTDGMRKRWTERSKIVCENLVVEQHLYLEHIKSLGSSTSITWVGSAPVAYSEDSNVAVIEGVVQCGSSSLSDDEVHDILVEGMFIFE